MEPVVVRWTGAAGLELTFGERVYLVNPYHSRLGKLTLLTRALRPRTRAVAAYADRLQGRIAAIVAGHSHFDHVLDVPALAGRAEGPIVGSRSLETLLELSGLPGRVTACRGGERVELPGGAAVTLLPSRHGLVAFGRDPYPGEIPRDATLPLKTAQYGHGDVFSLRLEIAGRTFLILDTANFIDESLAGESCDVLVACVFGWTKTPDFHERLFRAVTAETVVPYHFDDFTRPWSFDLTAPPLPLLHMDGFLDGLRRAAPRSRIIVPRPFEAMYF